MYNCLSSENIETCALVSGAEQANPSSATTELRINRLMTSAERHWQSLRESGLMDAGYTCLPSKVAGMTCKLVKGACLCPLRLLSASPDKLRRLPPSPGPISTTQRRGNPGRDGHSLRQSRYECSGICDYRFRRDISCIGFARYLSNNGVESRIQIVCQGRSRTPRGRYAGSELWLRSDFSRKPLQFSPAHPL